MKVILIFTVLIICTAQVLGSRRDRSSSSSEERGVGNSGGAINFFRNAMQGSGGPGARRFGPTDNQAAVHCVQNCRDLQHRKVLEKISANGLRWPPLLENAVEIVRINCEVNNSTRDCFEQCPESLGKTLASNEIAATNYGCYETTILQHLQCIIDTGNSTLDSCTSAAKCGHTDFGKGSQFRQCESNNTDRENIRRCYEEVQKSNLNSVCRWGKCIVTCAKPKVAESCGRAAVTDAINVIKRMQQYMRDSFEATGRSAYLPRDCLASVE